MPELKCTVQTCMHNKDFYCDLNAITVGGKSARKAAETSCDSFEERKSGTYSNVTGEAGPTSKIDCKAAECQYADASEWEEKAKDLAARFVKNFAKYEGNAAGKALVSAGPQA